MRISAIHLRKFRTFPANFYRSTSAKCEIAVYATDLRTTLAEPSISKRDTAMASTKPAVRKIARKPAAKKSAPKAAAIRRRAIASKPASPVISTSRFHFPTVEEMIASTKAALNDHESALGMAEQMVEKAIASVRDAEKALVEKSKVAKAKGTATAKSAMKKAQEQRKKANAMVGVAKGKYKTLKVSYNGAVTQMKKISKAQELLLSKAIKEEQKLLKQLMKAESKLLKGIGKKTKPKATAKVGAKTRKTKFPY